MFWAKGMVVWPFMFFKPNPSEVSDSLYRHELQHCYQVKKMGRFKFYTTYLWLLARHGYRQHPYEIEAWQRQYDPLTDQEKQWRTNGKIVL
jgi:hypothetical protein